MKHNWRISGNTNLWPNDERRMDAFAVLCCLLLTVFQKVSQAGEVAGIAEAAHSDAQRCGRLRTHTYIAPSGRLRCVLFNLDANSRGRAFNHPDEANERL